MRGAIFAAALAALLAASPAAGARGKFDWDALGAEFCRLTLAGDLPGLRPILTDSLAGEIAAAAGNPKMQPARVLFQTYVNEVPVCEAETINAALVEVRRSNPGGGAPAWREWLVVVPEADGTTRIDDILFATRRSDTLRARLGALAATR